MLLSGVERADIPPLFFNIAMIQGVGGEGAPSPRVHGVDFNPVVLDKAYSVYVMENKLLQCKS